MQDNRNSFIAFLVACFLVVGLAGLFASYAAAITYQRAFARLAALEHPSPPEPGAPAPLPDTPDSRRTILAEANQEAGAVLPRLRLLLAVLTALATVFGTGVALLLRRQAMRAAGGPVDGPMSGPVSGETPH